MRMEGEGTEPLSAMESPGSIGVQLIYSPCAVFYSSVICGQDTANTIRVR